MDELFAGSVPGDYSRGEEVPTDQGVHLIDEGSVGLYIEAEDTRRLIFICKQGEIFPLVAEAAYLPVRRYMYVAMTRLKLRTLDKRTFEQRVEASPEFGQVLMQQMHALLILQIERTYNLQKYQVQDRLLERLYFIAKRHGEIRGDKVHIHMHTSHVDLATSIGTSRETVNRYMKQFESQGLLTVRRQKITVNSMSKLQAMLGSDDDTSGRFHWVIPAAAISSLMIQGAALITLGN